VIKTTLFLFLCFTPIVLWAQEEDTTTAAPAANPADDVLALSAPVTPPTTTDGADALDDRLYLPRQEGPASTLSGAPAGSSKPYAYAVHAELTSEYDDNINLSKNHAEADSIQALQGGVAFGLGDFRTQDSNFLVIDYTGQENIYADHSGSDAYEQFASLNAKYLFARLTLTTHFNFSDLRNGDPDTGVVSRRRIFDTIENASYEVSEKQHLDFRAENLVHENETGLDSTQWELRGLYDYTLDPKVIFGGGVVLGLLDVQTASSQPYEQIVAHAAYTPSEKLYAEATGGTEIRQLPKNGGQIANPVFEITARYDTLAGLTAEVDAYRRVVASSSLNPEDFVATGVSLGVEKTVGEKIVLGLKTGYENNSYFQIDGGGDAREDNFFYLTPTLAYLFNEHARLQLFYSYRANDSSIAPLGFSDNQAGLRATINF
jgi:hypothetical protein